MRGLLTVSGTVTVAAIIIILTQKVSFSFLKCHNLHWSAFQWVQNKAASENMGCPEKAHMLDVQQLLWPWLSVTGMQRWGEVSGKGKLLGEVGASGRISPGDYAFLQACWVWNRQDPLGDSKSAPPHHTQMWSNAVNQGWCASYLGFE